MDKDFLQKFANNLKRIRKAKGIKQDDFMGVEGISRSTISIGRNLQDGHNII